MLVHTQLKDTFFFSSTGRVTPNSDSGQKTFCKLSSTIYGSTYTHERSPQKATTHQNVGNKVKLQIGSFSPLQVMELYKIYNLKLLLNFSSSDCDTFSTGQGH
jgi:hypothetical protein